MHLNHSETISSTPVCGKLSSMKLVPDAKEVGDCCSSLLAVCWRTTCLQCLEGITELWNGSDLRVDPFLLRPGTKQ